MSDEKQRLKDMSLELIIAAVTAIHAMCEGEADEEEVDQWVMEFCLFVLCSTAVGKMTGKEFSAITASGFEEMQKMRGEVQWQTTNIQ